MAKLTVALIVGARPNFVKIAPLVKGLRKESKFRPVLIHTGQHYDRNMSEGFFTDLEIPQPDINLGVESSTQVRQMAEIMIRIEKSLLKLKPALVITVGDVNSTLAAAITSAKLKIPLAHVEAGLRSFDKQMPEEINRIVTDALSDYLFTTCPDANQNLMKEGISKEKIFLVGNIMIDTLMLHKNKALRLNTFKKFTLPRKGYALLTLHRPSNVDNKESLKKIIIVLKKIAKRLPILFPVHPRTIRQISAFGLKDDFFCQNIKLTEPLGYLEFLNLMLNAKFLLTDSGGIQEEASATGIPCLTFRENTERPITIREGTNTLVGIDCHKILNEVNKILVGKYKKGKKIKLWDGLASSRIIKIIKNSI